MEDNLILEGLLSMVTELKEKQEAQATPASREETLERLGAIEQALSELHSNSAVPEEKLRVIQSQLDDIRSRMQGQRCYVIFNITWQMLSIKLCNLYCSYSWYLIS